MRVGKGRTYSRGHEKDAKKATMGLLATQSEARWWRRTCVQAGGAGYKWAAKMYAPLLVTVDKPWCHGADIRAGANE